MQILLPPSEGKTSPAAGRRPVNLAALSWPELTQARVEIVAQLAKVSDRPDALSLLKVGPSLAAEVRENIELRTAPAAPASSVYTGVLFDELDFPSLSLRAKRRAQASVIIFSGLWGALRPGDCIPKYRLPMTAKILESGGLASYWAKQLPIALEPQSSGLIVDCRSASYQTAWSPVSGDTQHVVVNVFREVRGRKSVVSHFAKLTRGQVARYLLERPGNPPRTAQSLALAIAADFDAELTAPDRVNPRWQLAIRAQE